MPAPGYVNTIRSSFGVVETLAWLIATHSADQIEKSISLPGVRFC
jgi:hypothetical protein